LETSLRIDDMPQLLNHLRVAVCLAAWAAATSALATAANDAVPVKNERGAHHVLRVGPKRTVTTVAEAARIASDGDTVEIDAGTYAGDVATWKQSNLTLRAVGGRAHFDAAGKAAEGKAIWVIKGNGVTVEGIDFSGSRVADRNGAGIRHEGGLLIVKNCTFMDNENGILTSNNPASELRIENSEFGRNGAGDGQSHDLYVGEIRQLTVTGSYFHHARVGHLLKSRAQRSDVMYNRLTDEIGGSASYELEFPGGGLAYVIGNVIEQSPQTQNSNIISYGAEGYRWQQNEIYLVNNTIVDDGPQDGDFLHIAKGAPRIVAINNLLLGRGSLEAAGRGTYVNNIVINKAEIVSRQRYDYRLTKSSLLVGKAADPGVANGVKLRPEREYVHPAQSRLLGNAPLSPGAMQSIGP
jgi:hypothetical protein